MSVGHESPGQILRRIAGIRLGRFCQDPPRPLSRLRLPAPLPIPSRPIPILLVTPSLNQGEFIGRTIRSVLDQRYPALTYRIQDGGSTDATHEVVRSFGSDAPLLRIEPDSGQADAINRGFAPVGEAEVLAWLNADDLLLPGALTHVAALFQRHPEVDVIYGDRLIVDRRDQVIGRWILPDHDATVTTWIDYIPQETLFWRRRAWEAIGQKLDSTLHFAMDWDVILRMQDAGCTIRHFPRLLGAFRVHESQKTHADYARAGRHEIRAIRKRHWRGLTVPFAHVAHLRYLYQHRRADCLSRTQFDFRAGPSDLQGTS